MLRKLRRQYERASSRRKLPSSRSEAKLRLESLERRILLDTAGWWDELGWRSASGGGVSWDEVTDAAEAEIVLSVDGDPVIFWVEGDLVEYMSEPIPFHFQTSGAIYAREYSGDNLSWYDLSYGSGDELLYAVNTTGYPQGRSFKGSACI